MNIRWPHIVVLFLLIGFSAPALQADSPLTSTPFHRAYMDLKVVSYAKEQGVVDKKIAKFLMKDKPLHQKAAVINALGWSMDGKNNAELFLEFLKVKRKLVQESDFANLTGPDLFCMGYMMALDNYFDVGEAFQVLSIAQTKMPENFTANFVLSLVEAQIMMDSDWCKVWQVVHKVEQNKSLERSMLPAAVKIVMEYIQLYQSECGAGQ